MNNLSGKIFTDQLRCLSAYQNQTVSTSFTLPYVKLW